MCMIIFHIGIDIPLIGSQFTGTKNNHKLNDDPFAIVVG